MKKSVLTINDIHAGSAYGLLPTSFVDAEGNLHDQNEPQRYLWDCFISMLDRIANTQKIDLVVFNGDLKDGNPGKSPRKAQDCVLHREEDQIEAVVKILEEVKNRFPDAAPYFVAGTPNHELPAEVAQIAYRLYGEAHRVHTTLHLRIGKAVVCWHHEVSFASGFNKTGPLESEIVYQCLAESMNNRKRIHAQVRAHCHYFAAAVRMDRIALVAPGWQLQTPYMTKGSPVKNIPNLGSVVVAVDDSFVEEGMCPVGYTPYLYPYPQPEIIEIEEEDAEDSALVTL